MDADHIVWIAASNWGGVLSTDRCMVTAMTRYARILWVDPPASLLTAAARRGDSPRRLTPRLSALDDRIVRLTPVALPGLTRPGIRGSTAPLVRAQIRWALRRTGIQPRAVVTTNVEDVLGRWDGAVSMLYVTDDYVAGAELLGLPVRRLQDQERRALVRADVVAVVSPALQERWAALGADPVLIPNGCAVASHRPAPVALGLPRPVVGLAGHLSARIDLRLLAAIAEAGYSLLLVGPHDPRWEPAGFAELAARPNVRHTGRVPAEEVAAYLAAADLGITPYLDSPFNRASFPIKTLEYLGAGLPVVSTSLPAARWLRDDFAAGGLTAGPDDVLVLADDPAGFVAAVGKLAGEPGRPAEQDAEHGAPHLSLAARCRACADRHSWRRRAQTLASALGLG